MSLGILAFGAYIPRTRLSRRAIAEATSWFDATLRGLAKGERSMAGWDEDPVTMAVEAVRDLLGDRDRGGIGALRFASTTFPFVDRLNAGVVAGALGLADTLAASDAGGSQRAATGALVQALTDTSATQATTLVVAAEQRRTRSASPLELTSGDAAAALLVGSGTPVARLVATASHTTDFVDHFRTPESEYDYRWEERWVRDSGFSRIVPAAVRQCLEAAGVAADRVTHFCLPTTLAKGAETVAKAVGIAPAAVRDNLQAVCGDSGAAHPLLMLVAALEEAKAGELILVASFGQGADALLFEVTPAIAEARPRLGVTGHLARRREEARYTKLLAFRNVIEQERGPRSEVDKQTPLSAMWRHRAAITGFIGGRCTACGTPQFPASRICVAPGCGAIDSQEPYGFAERIGRINSYTADLLTYAPEPPSCYGMITFADGGRWMMDFTDVDAGDLAVGMDMRMMFRIKDIDDRRGFRRYFWKAAPAAGTGAVKDA